MAHRDKTSATTCTSSPPRKRQRPAAAGHRALQRAWPWAKCSASGLIRRSRRQRVITSPSTMTPPVSPPPPLLRWAYQGVTGLPVTADDATQPLPQLPRPQRPAAPHAQTLALRAHFEQTPNILGPGQSRTASASLGDDDQQRITRSAGQHPARRRAASMPRPSGSMPPCKTRPTAPAALPPLAEMRAHTKSLQRAGNSVTAMASDIRTTPRSA